MSETSEITKTIKFFVLKTGVESMQKKVSDYFPSIEEKYFYSEMVEFGFESWTKTLLTTLSFLSGDMPIKLAENNEKHKKFLQGLNTLRKKDVVTREFDFEFQGLYETVKSKIEFYEYNRLPQNGPRRISGIVAKLISTGMQISLKEDGNYKKFQYFYYSQQLNGWKNKDEEFYFNYNLPTMNKNCSEWRSSFKKRIREAVEVEEKEI